MSEPTQATARQQFTMVVQAVHVVTIRPAWTMENTALRMCHGRCHEMTMHYRLPNGYQCAVCGQAS